MASFASNRRLHFSHTTSQHIHTQRTTNWLRKERGGLFSTFRLDRERLDSLWPLTLQFDPSLYVMRHSTPPLSFLLPNHRRGSEHAHTHWTEQLQCLSRRCVRHVDVSTEELSLSLSSPASVPVALLNSSSPAWTRVEKWHFSFYSVLSDTLLFHVHTVRSATHICCSSEVQ